MHLIAFAFALFIGAVSASPTLSKKYYDREAEKDFHLVKNDDGKIHLVDIHPVDFDIEPKFDALASVIFRLFTVNNPTVAQIITLNNDAQLINSNFNPNRQTRFHVHGWNSGGPLAGAFVRSALLAQGDFNVFVADWGAGSNTPEYALARGRVNDVGVVCAMFVDWINSHGVPYTAMSAIGLSLGAHVVGATGKRIHGRFPTMVGLDPAGPLFSHDIPQDRIDYTDADYVEIIYTDIGQLALEQPIGHANFYPNWGTAQPSSWMSMNPSRRPLPNLNSINADNTLYESKMLHFLSVPLLMGNSMGCENADGGGFCSHVMASEFYTESINPANVFGATRCSGFNDIRTRNCVQSGPSRLLGGEPVMDGPSAPGSVYFLTTHAARPFAQGPR